MINFLPPSMTPEPRTPKMLREDKVKQDAQAPLTLAYGNFLIGFLFIGLALALLLK